MSIAYHKVQNKKYSDEIENLKINFRPHFFTSILPDNLLSIHY